MDSTILFSEFDFSILDSPEFKEDAVREDIILPILTALGYTTVGQNRIVRSKALEHPFVYLGSQKHRSNIFPDYILQVQGDDKWVLDAKAPNETIHSGKNVEQAYSYAMHPDVRVRFYALCNGREFVVFSVDEKEAILRFSVPYMNDRDWSKLQGLLSAQAFMELPETHNKQTLPIQTQDKVYLFVEKRVGILWSNRLDISARVEIKKFKGKFLADAGEHSVKTVTAYELYLLPSGYYLVYIHRNHNLGEWREARLVGFDSKGMTLKEVQKSFPIVASKAGLSPIEVLDVE